MRAIATNRLWGWGATSLRVVVGLIFLAHGGQKLFGEGFSGAAWDPVDGGGGPRRDAGPGNGDWRRLRPGPSPRREPGRRAKLSVLEREVMHP